jgi:hypothetical protein
MKKEDLKKVLRILIFGGAGMLINKLLVNRQFSHAVKALLYHVVANITCWIKDNIGMCSRWCSVELRRKKKGGESIKSWKLEDEEISSTLNIFCIYTLTTYFNLFFVWPFPSK